MPKPVFPVVRLPYDQPDRVARVLDTLRREFKSSRRQSVDATASASLKTTDVHRKQPRCRLFGTTMTARVQHQTREHEKSEVAEQAAANVDAEAFVDTTVDQVTVGVRDCTLTPKARPEILVTAGGAPVRNVYHDRQHRHVPSDGGGYGNPYLIVPPVNITAEISRPPLELTSQYTATS